MTTETKNIPDMLLEKLVADELPEDAARALRARIEADDALAARVEGLRRSNAEVLATYPAQRIAVEIGHRVRAEQARQAQEAGRSRRSALLVLAPMAAVAAAVALVVGLWPADAPVGLPVEPPDQITFKGDPSISIHLQAEPRTVALGDGASVHAGDTLQVVYNARGKAHGVIVSVDGRGTSTLHFPESEDADTTLTQGGVVHLPHAYELDDAPRFERFFFVWSSSPIHVADVMSAAETLARSDAGATASLALPAGQPWGQKSISLRKVER